MKKILVSMLAVAAMVACSTEHTIVAPANNDAIGFDTFVDKTTRANDVTTETIKDFGFGVYASVTNGDLESGLILDNEKVTYDGAWGYSNTQYWVPGNTYNFAAFAPYQDGQDATWTYTPANGTAHNGEIYFDNEAAVANQDLVFAYAYREVAEAYTSTPESVKFTFGHMLSRVRFSFTNSFQSNNNIELKVTNVRITNAHSNGTLKFEAGAPADTWTPGTERFDVAFGGTDVFTEGNTAATTHYYLVPAVNADYTVTFDVTLYQAGVEIDTYSHSVDFTCSLNRGGSYDIKTSLTPENTSDEGAIYPIVFEVESIEDWVEVAEANSASDIQSIINDETVKAAHIVLTGDINLNDLLTRAASSASITIPAGKEVVLDIKEYTITGTDNETASFGMFNIQADAKLTIEGTTGKIQLTATKNRGWNAYSSVISNQRGEFVLNGGTIEHLGGTDMAYALDNLTNTGAGDAKATINGGVVKSPYRAVRLFLNSTKALDEVVVNGGTIEGANKSIWVQNANAKVNPGKLVVAENANLYGDVMVSGSNAPELAIELSVAEAALNNGSTVVPSNLPVGYDVVVKDGNWVVEYGVEENGDVVSVSNAAGLKWVANQVNSGADYFAGKTIVLTADIDLKGAEWTPIGSAYKDHGFMGNFNGNGFVIKNLAIKNITPDSDGYVYAGLFGVTEGVDKDNQNYIKDLVIENVNIETTGHIVAAAIAYPYYTELENIKVQGNVNIKGGDYTAGVLAYTRRCVDATNIAIEANGGSIEGNMTIGGVISDIQMNGGLTANYSNFEATGVTVKGVMHVGGISGIISRQTLDGATVENVTIVCDDVRKGIVAGSLGETSTIKNLVVENVTGATNIVGATFDDGSEVTNNGDVYTK